MKIWFRKHTPLQYLVSYSLQHCIFLLFVATFKPNRITSVLSHSILGSFRTSINYQ